MHTLPAQRPAARSREAEIGRMKSSAELRRLLARPGLPRDQRIIAQHRLDRLDREELHRLKTDRK